MRDDFYIADDGKPYCRTLKVLASLLGFSERTAQRHLSDGMPRKTRRGYDFQACLMWDLGRRIVAASDTYKGRQ